MPITQLTSILLIVRKEGYSLCKKIKRFEDLECWQESRILTRSIYEYTKRSEFSKDFRLTGQISGAAISVMNNICEGFDSKSNNEFIRL